MKSDVINHYDSLIDENNDPVFDPQPLKEYMDKWDGKAFLDALTLDDTKSILEIGVGTGRLALKIAPQCKEFYGIDISSKTIKRAKENLQEFDNVTLLLGDIEKYSFDRTFDVVYSSLTFMHIKNKKGVIDKISHLLTQGGRFVLSVDKSQNTVLEYGSRKITIYPDSVKNVERCVLHSGMSIIEKIETDFAHIFVIMKNT
ncbi:MAG: class I SAM-dependent methyltransferase [Clostridia bacterium]|jgi:ubiquinone/menaquinone biosynthesis C-methylase UbiE|nr:class I SAM-dependent methyltransferase [Clostridia bacterium]